MGRSRALVAEIVEDKKAAVPFADGRALAQIVADYEAEHSRLRREIAAANKRIEAARWGAVPRREEAQRELGALVLAVYDELAEIERDHEEAVCKLRDDAVEQATRLLETAREKAVIIRARATGLAPPAEPADGRLDKPTALSSAR